MHRIIAIRAKKEIIAIFNRYAAVSGKQDKGRPQAIVDFISYVANLSDEEAYSQLKAAAVMEIDVSNVNEDMPQQIRVVIDIEEDMWKTATDKFKNVFGLKQLQIPYFLRVSGMACINYTEQYNARKLNVVTSSITDIESFKQKNLDEKLCEIYKILKIMLDNR